MKILKLKTGEEIQLDDDFYEKVKHLKAIRGREESVD